MRQRIQDYAESNSCPTLELRAEVELAQSLRLEILSPFSEYVEPETTRLIAVGVIRVHSRLPLKLFSTQR
jgi:hypothetical protein